MTIARRTRTTSRCAGIAFTLALLACASEAAAQSRQRRGRGSKRRAPVPAQQQQVQEPAPQGQDPYGYGQQPAPQGQDPYGYGYGQQPVPQGQDPYGYGQQPAPQGQDPYGYGYGQQPVPQGQDPYGYGQPPGAPPPEEATAEVDAPAAEPSPVDPTLVLGAGATSRDVELPSENGLRQLETGLVPAVELRLDARVYGTNHHIQITAAYQSSLAIDGSREPLGGGVAVETPIRTHRLELGVAPAYRFDEGGRDGVSLGLLLAYGLRAFDSVVELPVPRYTLHGPLARIELEVPLAERLIVLRVAPELQLFVSASRDLRDVGSVEQTALALGVEASLQIRATSWASVQLAFRESHASAGTGIADETFADVERFVLLSAVIHYFGGQP